ncbi:hypothetical protein INS49_004977 [Diaporthe citri]|uniref:uncharacterized protein n=1 Tax=Diaporthe citri TaxID=83186 RepID=UPI001C7F17EB|nr:uncharacterized protein INS49_004977 [Diaporthe citri]KAG6354006.1 hypothetical protein INS49_004977 [Diaporthe citri]
MARERKYFRARPERNYTYETTLAIDWGSEAVRAKLYYKMGDGQPAEKLLQHISIMKDIQIDRREVKRQFTSHIYPYGNTSPNPPGEDVYPGNNRLPGRRSISSKLGMYAVVGISDEVARQSPELQELRALVRRKPQLKQIIRIGIEQIMYRVLRKVYESFAFFREPTPRVLDAIALTIPAQWTIEFEEEYGELLISAWDRVFDCRAPQLIFLSEGQTNAHFAFYRDTITAMHDRQHLSHRGFFDIGRCKNAVLIIDAGGHCTNTSLVTVCHDDNQLEVLPDRGAIGGTALWAWHVLERAKAAWEHTNPLEAMPVEIENQILKIFYLNCPDYREDTGAPFDIYDCGPNRDIFHHRLSPEELVQTFEDANTHAFSLIEDGIVELKALRRSCERIKIVIGGGSAQGAMWLACMTNLCTRHQMEEPIYIWQIDHIYEHARLAAGANYALAKAKSVAQFVDRAAFGLAVKKGFRGADGWTYDWHYRASMLWARGNKWAKTITTDGTEKFKVICQPEYDSPRAKSTIEPNYKAYDLLPIPCRTKGILQFDFEIDTDTDQLKLTIKHRRVSKLGKTGRSTELGKVEFDLWVPPGSRCLQIWDCVEDIESKVTTAFAGQQDAEDTDGSEGDEAEEMDIDSGAQEQPIQKARKLRSSLRGSASRGQQAAADVDMDAMAPEEEDQNRGGNSSSAAPLVQAQAGAPQGSAEDVEMGGMEDEEETADTITVAPVPEEPSQPPHTRGQGAPRRRRRGSRVSRGIFAL